MHRTRQRRDWAPLIEAAKADPTQWFQYPDRVPRSTQQNILEHSLFQPGQFWQTQITDFHDGRGYLWIKYSPPADPTPFVLTRDSDGVRARVPVLTLSEMIWWDHGITSSYEPRPEYEPGYDPANPPPPPPPKVKRSKPTGHRFDIPDDAWGDPATVDAQGLPTTPAAPATPTPPRPLTGPADPIE